MEVLINLTKNSDIDCMDTDGYGTWPLYKALRRIETKALLS